MVNSTGRFILSLALRFFLVLFRTFSSALTSLVKERSGLCDFHAFVCFALVGLCLLVSGIG